MDNIQSCDSYRYSYCLDVITSRERKNVISEVASHSAKLTEAICSGTEHIKDNPMWHVDYDKKITVERNINNNSVSVQHSRGIHQFCIVKWSYQTTSVV
jgi:hypothetical protein